jgi:parallel beta-helix repeat protein
LLEDRQLLAAIAVNTAADDSTADATLSLREAIEVSNGTLAVSSLSTQEQAQVSGAVGAMNTISFNIPTTDPGYNAATGVWTIALQSELPAINTDAVIINGYSQPGALENTLAQGDNAKLTIALDGVGAANGLTIEQPGSQVFGLDIEHFRKDGVLVTAAGNVQVAGCFIGTDPTGETAVGNGTGVEIENSSNLIGGPNVGDRNVLSGSGNAETPAFVHDGVYVPDKANNPLGITPTGNVIENNIIGLDAKGSKVLDNDNVGVEDDGSGDVYGGTAPGLGNVISGNFFADLSTTGNVTVEGNYIGTDVTGTVAVQGTQPTGEGIFSMEPATATSIAMTITNNLIAGPSKGIELIQTVGSQSSYTIANNLIGTDASGSSAIAVKGEGIDLYSVENATVQDNVISAYDIGVRTATSTPAGESQHDVFQGNLIGTDKTGNVALGNTLQGIEINSGTGIAIGGTGPGQGNVIANNGYYGIYLVAGEQIQITRNAIFGNAKQGIYENYLTNGPIGPPDLTFTPGTGGTGTLSGTIAFAKKNASYDFEIFSDPTSQFGAGQTFLQSVPVTTDGNGNASFSISVPNGFYSATTTDSLGDTSEFSDVAGTAGLPATVTSVSSSANPSMDGQRVTFTAIVSAAGVAEAPTGTVTFTIDGIAQTPVPLSLVGGVDEAQFVSSLTAGAHTVTASYGGDSNVGPSIGSLPNQTVNPVSPDTSPTTTSLASSSNPSSVGEQITFTAVVSSTASTGTPTGTVTFTIDGIPQVPRSLSLVDGQDEAVLTISTLSAGNHTVEAEYNGDATFASSTPKSPLGQAVQLQATTITLGSSVDPSTVGQQVVFTATVDPPGAMGSPTGSVIFTIDGETEPPAPVHDVNGRSEATFSTAALAAGMHTVTATYDGDTAFAPSTVSTPLMHTVTATSDGDTVFAPSADSTPPKQTVTATSDGDTAFAPSADSTPPKQTVRGAVADPLTVESVKRFGIHRQHTAVVLTFSTTLNVSAAQDTRNYVILNPAHRRIAIDSAVYNPATHTVTLRPHKRINVHHVYGLTVIGTRPGAVTGADGTPLDPAGVPGTNFVTSLSVRNLVLTPAQARKYGRAVGRLVHQR